MNRKHKLLLAVLAFSILLFGTSVIYTRLASRVDHDNLSGTNSTSQNQQTAPNGAAQEQASQFPPDFTVVDASGKEVKLSDFRGKPVVLNFWATWCGYCKQEMPTFEKVYQQMGNEIHFLMVDVVGGSETVEKAKEYIENSGYTFPVYYDTQHSAAAAYGISSLPVTYFFDAEGYGVAYAMSAIDEDALLRGIAMITEP